MMRWRGLEEDEGCDADCVELLYFEVTEYEEPELDLLACNFDAESSVGTDSSGVPLGVDEQTLDDDPCSLWPALDQQSSYDRASSRDSITSEPLEPLDPVLLLEESAATLLAMTPPVDAELAGLAKASLEICEREGNRRGTPCCGDQLSMNQVLARRAMAATVLSQGCERHNDSPLPMIPAVVAQQILEEALPLAAPLTHFVNVTGVDLRSALQLKCLQLSSCGLNADTAGVVRWLLRHNPNVRELDVSGNPLGVAGASIIASALPAASGLTTLAMNDVTMCSAGGTDPTALASLAHSMEKLPELRTLELRGNALGASGFAGLRALCASLVHSSCPLRSLDLSSNSLQSAGAAIVAVALLQTPRLEEVYLGSNLLTGARRASPTSGSARAPPPRRFPAISSAGARLPTCPPTPSRCGGFPRPTPDPLQPFRPAQSCRGSARRALRQGEGGHARARHRARAQCDRSRAGPLLQRHWRAHVRVDGPVAQDAALRVTPPGARARAELHAAEAQPGRQPPGGAARGGARPGVEAPPPLRAPHPLILAL